MQSVQRLLHSSVACPSHQAKVRRTLAVALMVMGCFSNAIHVPILFGVDFIFGSVASLIAAAWFGWPIAALVAVCASAGTIQLWHHPYFVLISVAEAIFIAVTYRRFWDNVLVACTIFWLIPGVLIFSVCYGLILHIQPSAMLMLWLKQCINSIFNAMIASGILLAIALLKRPDTRIPLQQACFNTLVAFVFIPALAIVMAVSNTKIKTSQANLITATESQAENIGHYLNIWRDQNINAVISLANVAKELKLTPSADLQRDIHVIHSTNRRFADMFVADANANTVAFDPKQSANGDSLIGLNFSDRDYFRDIKRGHAPLVSDIFQGRGGINLPIVCFVVPILSEGDEFNGFALASVDVRELTNTLRILISDPSFEFTVSDTKGNVVTSNVKGIAPLIHIDNYYGNHVEMLSANTYRKSMQANHSAAYEAWQNMVLGSMIPIPALGWTVRVEAPLGRYMSDAESFYIEGFAQMLALTLAGMTLSFLAVVWVSSPIEHLASSTRDITRQPLSSLNLKWPRTRFAEISDLVDNFKSMADSLRQRFLDLNREVQERKDAESRLQIAMEHAHAANIAKSAFLANMSHEIRTPLAAIIGYAELIEADQTSGDEQNKSIDAILRNGKQLSQLVDDILDLSKIEAGHLKILPEWLTIDELIVGGIEVLSQRARYKGLELLITGAGKFPMKIFVDPVRIRQILFNIVGNAIKFTESGQVNVALTISPNDQDQSKGTLSITVTDTGGGIEPMEQPAIFEPFVQADSSYSRRHGGTGLGLTLSRILTQALGGQVRLLSSSKNNGSVFEVMVTVGLDRDCEWYESLGAARQIATEPETKRPKPLELAGRQILLVEDSQDNRALISRMLMRYGALVECATSGDEGIRMGQAKQWDVILMDMQMPGTDGHQATSSLRALGYQGPIIALTAHALTEEHERSLNSGCNAHVTKPVNWVHLVSVINKYCRAV